MKAELVAFATRHSWTRTTDLVLMCKRESVPKVNKYMLFLRIVLAEMFKDREALFQE
jgi:hypothetical protein